MTREEAERMIREATGMKYGLGKAVDLLLRIADEQWNAALDAAAENLTAEANRCELETPIGNHYAADMFRVAVRRILSLKREVK